MRRHRPRRTVALDGQRMIFGGFAPVVELGG
jgi:uncharacterized protein YbaA (DUF1428 family)